ncbi:MAG: HlyD family efflux transporter periplasmic adaptor subunit [Alphaproteobacteria bacterium]
MLRGVALALSLLSAVILSGEAVAGNPASRMNGEILAMAAPPPPPPLSESLDGMSYPASPREVSFPGISPAVLSSAPAEPPGTGGGLFRGAIDTVTESYRATLWWIDEAMFELSYALGNNKTPLDNSPLSRSLAESGKGGPSVGADTGPSAEKEAKSRYRIGGYNAVGGIAQTPPRDVAPAEVPAPTPRVAAAEPAPTQPDPTPSQSPPPEPDAAVKEAPPKPEFPEVDLAKEIPVLDRLGFDMPFRQDDGSFFIPKSVQRLYGIRTMRVISERRPMTTKLTGQIIPDPDSHGDVEASIVGRYISPEGGMPFVGQSVTKNQVLGYVEPSVGVIERSKIRREIARLASEIKVAAASIERLKRFFFVPFREGSIRRAQMELDGLRQEQTALMPMLAAQEILRASTTGIISVSHAQPGRIIQAGEPVFQIVNPRKVWIQAVAANLDVIGMAEDVAKAVAVTPEGQSLELTYVGSGIALQNQTVPLLFRVDSPVSGLRIGRPSTVTIESRQRSREGITVPQEAVVNSASGVDEVWERTGPETFVPRPVVTEFADGKHLRILAGVSPGTSIVVRGARLLIQLH